MKTYPVRLTDRAAGDMAEIYRYVAEVLLVPSTAMKLYDRIAAEIESLAQFPERCALFASEPERSLGMRRLLVGNYSVIYVVEDEAVTVLRVLYSASDILSRLREER